MRTNILVAWYTVALYGSAFAQDSEHGAIRECMAVGLKATISAEQYEQLLGRIAILPNTDKLVTWAKEYGRNNLSSFVVYNEPFERRVFSVDYLTSPPEIAQAVFGHAGQSGHVCEASDIGAISINYSDEERGVLVGQVTIERRPVYRVICLFVATRIQTGGKWRLEFLGVANRFSSDIRHSRPVFVRSDRWDEIDLQLRALGIPLSSK